MSVRVGSGILDGRDDRLPSGRLLLGVFVAVVALVLLLAGAGGWFGVVAIAVVVLAVIAFVVRAGNWPPTPSDEATDGQ